MSTSSSHFRQPEQEQRKTASQATPGNRSAPSFLAHLHPGTDMDAVPTLIIAPPQSAPASASTSAPKQRRRDLRIVLALLVLLVLLGSGLSAFFWLSQRNTVTTSRVLPIVGHAFFESSGFLSKESTQGINDELLLTFQNIPTPHPGKSYSAWLLGDKQQTPLTVISLGKLQVMQGAVHLLYLGDAHHGNL